MSTDTKVMEVPTPEESSFNNYNVLGMFITEESVKAEVLERQL